MNPLRDAVRHVQECARRGMLTALDAVLTNPGAQRGVRLAAANYLAQAGEPGLALLRAALREGELDCLGRLAASKSLHMSGMLSKTEARMYRLYRRGWVPLIYKAELRRLLPEPFQSTPHFDRKLKEAVETAQGADWQRIVRALCQVDGKLYLFLVPTLMSEMGKRGGEDVTLLAQVIANFGQRMVPVLVRSLPHENASLRRGAALALEIIGDPVALGPLEAIARLHPALITLQEVQPQVRQSLENLRQKNRRD